MPITVRIAPLPSGVNEPGYVDAFRRAAELWEEATDGLIRVRILGDDETDVEPDIPVTWVVKLPPSTLENHLARTTLIRPTRETFRLRMEIGLFDRTTGSRLSVEEMLTVCLHELGHAFGLWGHSDVEEDVMSPASVAQAPTARDAATLRRLYSLPVNTPLHEEALTLLRTKVEANPGNANLRFLLGSILLDAGDTDDAIDALNDALRIDPDHKAASEKLILAYLAAGRTAEAIERMQTAGDASAEFYNNAGIAFADQGARDKAIQAFENALRLRPDFNMARRNLARLYAEIADEAAQAGDYAAARAPMARAVELFPEHTPFAIQLGVILTRLGRAEEALKVYDGVLARDPDSAEVRENIAKTYNNLGVDRVSARDWPAALTNFNTALQYAPDLAEAKANRKLVLWRWAESLEATDAGRALNLYEQYLKEDPTSSEAYVRIGVLYAKHKNLQRAIDAFSKAHALDPDASHIRDNLVTTIHQLGVRLDQQGLHEAAVEQFRRALDIGPERLDVYRSLGLAYKELGKREEAAQAFLEILKRDPNDEWAQKAIVNLALQAGNDALRRRDYRRAIREFSQVPESARTAPVYGILGYLYLEIGEPGKAADALGHALLLDPTDRPTRSNLDLCIDTLAKAKKKEPSSAVENDLLRARVYASAADVGRRQRASDLEAFASLLEEAISDAATRERIVADPNTVAAIQKAIAFVAARMDDAETSLVARAVHAGLSLNADHPALRQWADAHATSAAP